MYLYIYRSCLALSEYNFTFNFCRKLIKKFGFKVWLRYRFGDRFAETSVLRIPNHKKNKIENLIFPIFAFVLFLKKLPLKILIGIEIGIALKFSKKSIIFSIQSNKFFYIKSFKFSLQTKQKAQLIINGNMIWLHSIRLRLIRNS